MEPMVLYTASWSIHCRKAEDLLDSAGVPFVRRDLSDSSILGAASRDLDIRKLPFLSGGSAHYEGLAEITEFIKGHHEY